MQNYSNDKNNSLLFNILETDTDTEALFKVFSVLDRNFDERNETNIVNMAVNRLYTEFHDFVCLKCDKILIRQSEIGKFIHNVAHVLDKYIPLSESQPLTKAEISEFEDFLNDLSGKTVLSTDQQEILEIYQDTEVLISNFKRLIPSPFLEMSGIEIVEINNQETYSLILENPVLVSQNFEELKSEYLEIKEIIKNLLISHYIALSMDEEIDTFILSLLDHDFNEEGVCKGCNFDSSTFED